MSETTPEPQTEKPPSEQIKVAREWLTFIIAIVAAISGIIFWIQSSSNLQYERIEKDVSSLKYDMKEIQKQNGEILRLVGQLEGKIEGLSK